ncbi:hypothetical protein Hte_010582 [Hypoxylon texense]
MQKSFEGLLRSVLSQIISERPEMSRFLQPMFKHKKFLTPDDWTLPILQKGLHAILAQEKEPLHLCLFLDAIDEYDGRLESICQFLEALGRIDPKPNKVIKVCFSSRPWEVFLKYFRHCAGFRIQDFTQDDIRDYCLGSLMEERISSIALETFVPHLVARSRGVFLWVKLVIKDLAKAAGVSSMSKTELERLLESYPTELDSYYVEIIERIPHIHRWKAYAMLEIAVRSNDIISPIHFVLAVNCSGLKTYDEVSQVHENLPDRDMEFWAEFVSLQSKKYCGGLIEVMFGTEGHYIQVLHQTVKDFVMDSKFKELVLGDQAKITVENGNAFLAKCRLLTHYDELADGTYARNAEKTSGRSLKAFLDTVPRHVFQKFKTFSSQPDVESPLAYAAATGLRLYIIESLAVDPNLIRESTEPLLNAVVKPGFAEIHEDFVQTASLLLDNGFALNQDPTAFSNLLEKIPSGNSSDTGCRTLYIEMAKLLLNHGQDPNVDVIVEDNDDSFFKCAPVNALNSKKMTPLDSCGWNRISDGVQLPGTGDYNSWDTRELSLLQAYEITCLLVSHGGEIRKLRSSSMKLRLKEFESRGWPTEEIRARLFPPMIETIGAIASKFMRMSSPSGRV